MATVPVTRTFVAGEVVLASHFNTNIRDPLNYLLAPPILEIYQSTLQALTTATFTAFTFTSEDVDSSGMHSNSVNTSRATAVYPGWYRVGGAGAFTASATGGRVASLYKNGTAVNGGASSATSAGASLHHSQVVRSKLIFHNVGDYTEIFGYQNTGGNLNTLSGTTDCASLSMKWDSN